MQTAPSKAADPNAELQTPQQGYDPPCAAVNPTVLRKRLLLPLDGKLSPASPRRRPTLAGKPSLVGTTLVPPLCFAPAPPGTPISPVSLPGEPPMGPYLLPSQSKDMEHSENLAVSAFSCQFKKRSSLAHTRTEDVNPRHFFLEMEGSFAASLSFGDGPPRHGPL